jgi:hypothetical protein
MLDTELHELGCRIRSQQLARELRAMRHHEDAPTVAAIRRSLKGRRRDA